MHYYNDYYIPSDNLLEEGLFLPNDISFPETIEEQSFIKPKFIFDNQYSYINLNEEFFFKR